MLKYRLVNNRPKRAQACQQGESEIMVGLRLWAPLVTPDNV